MNFFFDDRIRNLIKRSERSQMLAHVCGKPLTRRRRQYRIINGYHNSFE